MNPGGGDMYYSSHMSTGQAPPPPPQTVAPSYPHPQQHHPHPPVLQPVPGQYQPPPYGNSYGYANNLAQPVPASMPPTQPVLPLPGVNQNALTTTSYSPGFDTTGQIAPPGMKPRVTATLWEDEGSLCFQVEARGICVARRDDNHMINGTKLLNVAGMTRGRRDGILKSEKIRHVVKIGPMHLKGVWIPFERALDFANKEKITELLYPLFVHDIGSLLCHPSNSQRTSQVMAAAQRRQESLRSNPSAPALPSLQHHQPLALPGPQPPLSSHPPPSMVRPAIDRSHPFPASPGPSIQNMQSYPPVSQSYENTRQLYPPSAVQPSTYPGPSSNSQDRPMYSPSTYVKNEMGPPSSMSAAPNGEHVDAKPTNGIVTNGQSQGVTATGAEEEADHEHDNEYTHDSGGYDTNRGTYNYSVPPVASLVNDHSHLSSDMSCAPHQAGSGRATPRTAAAPQPYYAPQGYGAPNGSTSSLKRGRDDEDDRSDPKRLRGMPDGPSSEHSSTFNPQMAQPATASSTPRRR